MGYTTITQLARQIGVLPRDVSDLFYQQRLDESRCPLAGRTRLIPVDYVPEIKRLLNDRIRRRSFLRPDIAASCVAGAAQ